MIDRVREMLANWIYRAKVTGADTSAARVRAQVTGFNQDVFDQIELMLPYGYSAVPIGGDVIILAAAGTKDHKVALLADNTALRITSLAPGEFGMGDGLGNQVVIRNAMIEVTGTTKPITVTSAELITIAANGGIAVTSTGGTTMNLTCDAPVILAAPEVHLGAVGGRRVVLDGDPVSTGGTVTATSTKAWGA